MHAQAQSVFVLSSGQEISFVERSCSFMVDPNKTKKDRKAYIALALTSALGHCLWLHPLLHFKHTVLNLLQELCAIDLELVLHGDVVSRLHRFRHLLRRNKVEDIPLEDRHVIINHAAGQTEAGAFHARGRRRREINAAGEAKRRTAPQREGRDPPTRQCLVVILGMEEMLTPVETCVRIRLSESQRLAGALPRAWSLDRVLRVCCSER